MSLPMLPLRELRRRPSRFIVATVVLSFLATLLLFLGGLLDGLYLGSTGAIRAQQGDVIVFSSGARDSFLRSRITADVREQVAAADGVQEVGGIGFVLLGAQVPGESQGTGFARVGEVLSYDGRLVGFWGSWGAETRPVTLIGIRPGSGKFVVATGSLTRSKAISLSLVAEQDRVYA